MKKILLAILLISIIGLFGCVQQTTQQNTIESETEVASPPEPEQEPEEELPPEPEEPQVELPEEIQALFDKAKQKTKSLHYSYRGPETDYKIYEIFIKENLVRIILADDYKDVHLDNDAFNAIYLDTDLKTGGSHCDDQMCIKKGKKKSASYNDYNFNTPLDWIDEITEAEKIGEEKIDNRKSWKLDTNIGIVYVDSFSGIIQRIIANETEYSFIRIGVNGVSDEEVRP